MQLSVAIATGSTGGKWTANWSKIGEQLQKEWLPWSESEGWRLRISGMCPHACWKERRLVNWRGLEGDSTRALIRDAPEADTLNPGSSFAFVGKKGWLGKELQPQPCERFPRSSHHGVPRCRRSPTHIQRYSRNCIPAYVWWSVPTRCIVIALSRFRRASTNGTMKCIFRKRTPQPPAESPLSLFSRRSHQQLKHPRAASLNKLSITKPQRSLSSLIRSTPSPIHGPVIAT